jgi:hypothetical protein
MKLHTYCNNMTKELVDVKGKIDDIAARFNSTACGEKAKVLPQIADLHIMSEELEGRIEDLRTSCEGNWEAPKDPVLRVIVAEPCGCVVPNYIACGCC